LPLGLAAAPILIWVLVLTGMALDRTETGAAAKVFSAALESPLPTWLGRRSYSTYLGHALVLAACIWTWSWVFPDASKSTTFWGVGIMLALLTLVFAEVLYRTIERPGIALGARIAARLAVRAAKPAIGRRRARAADAHSESRAGELTR
jgi:peptidoglycan/LPS O-acetylase OafA/YrhL